MKKALTFLAVSTLSFASIDNFGDDEFHVGASHHVSHAPSHHGPSHQTTHHTSVSHQPSHHTPVSQQHHKDHKTQDHKDHLHPSIHKDNNHKTNDKKQNDKHPKPEKSDGKSMNFSPPKSDKPSAQQGSPSGNGLPLGQIIKGVMDMIFHPGQHKKSDVPQQTLEEDTYTVAELESFFEFFRSNESGLNMSFDDAWSLWTKNPHKKESTYKSSSDTYTVHELESFFTYMKKNQKSLNKDFDECWDGWDAWKSNKKDNAHDNAMFHLHDLMKEGLEHSKGKKSLTEQVSVKCHDHHRKNHTVPHHPHHHNNRTNATRGHGAHGAHGAHFRGPYSLH